MIIAISGKAGSGKSTVAKELAKRLKLRHYSIGDLMRRMARQKSISLLELSRLAEKDKKIDKELDQMQINLGKKEKHFVIDGRLTAFFIPKADAKIFLDCDDGVRAKRIIKDERKDEKGRNLKEVINHKELYDLVIDTTFKAVEEVVDDVMEFIELMNNPELQVSIKKSKEDIKAGRIHKLREVLKK
ncbi:nucleoside monophosphate kinase [Candidatus Woesearchaeota archaeon]|nr:nucleoside monophosphate kinase [Candidatus Woesearchaeota archaeon]